MRGSVAGPKPALGLRVFLQLVFPSPSQGQERRGGVLVSDNQRGPRSLDYLSFPQNKPDYADSVKSLTCQAVGAFCFETRCPHGKKKLWNSYSKLVSEYFQMTVMVILMTALKNKAFLCSSPLWCRVKREAVPCFLEGTLSEVGKKQNTGGKPVRGFQKFWHQKSSSLSIPLKLP